MKKQIIISAIILLLCLSFVSCDLDTELYKNVEYMRTEDDKHCLLYQDLLYYRNDQGFFSVCENTDEINGQLNIMLGWSGIQFFGYIDKYYSYTVDEPIYIYNSRINEMYLWEDYDYKSDIFVLEGTSSKIVFSNAITETEFDYNVLERYSNKIDIELYSEQCPQLRVPLTLFSHSGKWYVCTLTCNAYQVSNDFVDLLVQTGFILRK